MMFYVGYHLMKRLGILIINPFFYSLDGRVIVQLLPLGCLYFVMMFEVG